MASFRDPQLIPTIKDIFKKAKYPERLTFGIVWQYSEEDKWDDISFYFEKDNFTILKVPFDQSPGLGWARSKTQEMWKGEKYTLQIDSHMRFLKDWDEELIWMMKATEVQKPIITTYGTMYHAETDSYDVGVYKINTEYFTDRETIFFRPEVILDWEKYNKPIPSCFVSGHFFFTLGIHCKEYKYDPTIFFTGDEISLSTRSYTLGYDIFRPNKPVVWHQYTRESSNRSFGIPGQNLQEKSKKRLKDLWENSSNLGEYGFGTVRSLEDWEDYTGVCMKLKSIHPDQIKRLDPPISANREKNWRTKYSQKKYKLNINWKNKIEKEVFDSELKFMYIGIFDEKDDLCLREDLVLEEILKGKKQSYETTVSSYKLPFKVRVWPNSFEKGWLNYIDIWDFTMEETTNG